MFVMSPKLYDLLKRLVQVVFPAFSSLYFGLAEIWGLPGATQVVGTVALVTTFLGISLGISSSTYNKLGKAYDGNLNIMDSPEEGKKIFEIELTAEPEVLQAKDEFRVKVVRHRPLVAGPDPDLEG